MRPKDGAEHYFNVTSKWIVTCGLEAIVQALKQVNLKIIESCKYEFLGL